MREQSCDWCREIDGPNNFNSFTSTSSDGPWLWGIWSVFMYFFCYELCYTDPYLMFDEGSFSLLVFIILAWCDAESSMWCTCCHDFSCYVLRSICCMLMGYSCYCHSCLNWDPFCAMLAGFSSCKSLSHTDRSILTESSCSGTSLGATPTWAHPPCMIATSSICTSSLLKTLNATTNTILTSGPGDVVPPGWTLLSTAYVFYVADDWHVPLLYNMHMYSLMFF